MSNLVHVPSGTRANASELNPLVARSAKLDTITAAMLTGGASGGWRMGRAFTARAAREADLRARHRRKVAHDGRRPCQAA